MTNRRSILAAHKAVSGTAQTPGAPQASGAWGSGAAAMANAHSQGWATAYGQPSPGLPRPPGIFTDGAFGPLSPILPVPVNNPPEGSDFPEPRLFENEVGWNLPVGQPGSEGIKLADFGTLKTLADLYSVARACIQLRKNEIRGIEWDILPTRDASKAMRGAPNLARSFGARRSEAVKFFKRPDPDFFNWASFLDALCEEVFVYDALSILVRPKWARGRGAGLLGSDLDSISLLSGPTIRPLLGLHAERPRPPAPAYQQYLYGVPRVDIMSLITERDLDSGMMTGAEMNQFRSDQLLYLPMVPRRWTPYGFPPIERALIPVMSGLQKQGYALDYYREGSVPAVYISPGGANANMTPNQIRELQDALNALAGDPAWKHKIIVLPADSKVMPQKQTQLADQFDEIVMNQVCVVPGTEILTKRGLVKIEDIEIGDQVLTHRNRWRPVLVKFKNQRNGREMRRLEAKGLDTLELTTDHKVWSSTQGHLVTHKSFTKETGWVQAGQMKAKRTRGDFDTMTVPVPEFGSDGSLTYDHGLALGYFMAEGHSTSDTAVWSFHNKEEQYRAQVIQALDAAYGLKAVEYARKGTSVTEVRCYNTEFAKSFSFGTATNKVLPDWVWDAPEEFFEGLLEGWINGDGCKTATGYRGYTASKDLAWQMRLVALMLGKEATLRTQKQPESSIKGRKLGGQGFIYVVQWVEGKTRASSFKTENGLVSTALRTNEVSEYEEDVVWDLNVQEDHSYLTTGGLVSNCMAFDVQPMELGIMPKVSTSVSPGAANQMSKASQNIHERKATKPFLSFVADIMNVLLQEVCGQSDMRFMFEGLEEGEDEQVKTDILIAQVGASLRSIDEAREELDLQPWGLPETSDPGWATATGWTPLTEAIAAQRTQSQEGAVFAGGDLEGGAPAAAGASADSSVGTEPGSPAQPGSMEDASPAAGLEVPSNDSAATPGHAAAEAATGNQVDLPLPTAKTVAPDVAKGNGLQERRDKRVAKASDKVEEKLTEIVDAIRDDKMDRNKAVALAVTVLTSGYKDIIEAATKDAEEDLHLDYTGQQSSDNIAWKHGEQQRQWLDGLIQKAIEDPNKKLKGRIGLYVQTLDALYNKSYAQAARESGREWRITWVLGGGENCEACAQRDGEQFTFATLPGIPGEGEFGGDVCLGGIRCKCSLDFEEARRKDTSDKPFEETGHTPLSQADLHQRVADIANSRTMARGKHPAQLLKPEDISEDDVVNIFASKTRAILSELEAMARHVKKGRRVSDWVPNHLTPDVLARVNEYMAKGADVDTAVQMIRQQRLVDSAGQVYWKDIIGDWQPGEGRVHGGYEKKPHDVNDIPFTPKGATDLDDPNTVSSEHILNMMLSDFSPRGLKWVTAARWVGPIEVPLERIDFDDVENWAASHEPEKVAEFVKALKKGKKVKPGISVRQTEGDARIKIVDGHHRVLACKELDKPFITYLAFVPEGDDRWEQTHSYQYVKANGDNAGARMKRPGDWSGEKVSKASVNYRKASGSGKNCGTCSMFREPGSCTLVEGLIKKSDTCDRWERADATKQVRPAAVGDAPGEGLHLGTPNAPASPTEATADPTALQSESELMNNPELIQFFETGAGGAQIKWGTTGDISRCVTLATQTLGLENAQSFCQIRYSKMTGMESSGLIHEAPSGPTAGGN